MDIGEIVIADRFSSARVTMIGKEYGFRAGESMDLQSGWDFTEDEDRSRAWKKLRSDRPQLVIGSPACTAFSKLQKMTEQTWRSNASKEKKRTCMWKQAAKHVEFRIEPDLGPSQLCNRCCRTVCRVLRVKTTMCRFGMMQVDSNGKDTHIKTQTRFATNSWGIADELDKRCDGRHTHCHLVAGCAIAAEIYPDKPCKSICRGIKKVLDTGSTDDYDAQGARS